MEIACTTMVIIRLLAISNGDLTTRNFTGLKQVGFHNDFWADHDPDAHGEPETFKDDPDFQDGFVWSCCKGAGDAEGCVVTRHVAAAADDDDDRENKARKTSESEASADEDEEEDHR